MHTNDHHSVQFWQKFYLQIFFFFIFRLALSNFSLSSSLLLSSSLSCLSISSGLLKLNLVQKDKIPQNNTMCETHTVQKVKNIIHLSTSSFLKTTPFGRFAHFLQILFTAKTWSQISKKNMRPLNEKLWFHICTTSTTVQGTSDIWWRNLFSEKRLSPRFSAFGQWATQIWIPEASIQEGVMNSPARLVRGVWPSWCHDVKSVRVCRVFKNGEGKLMLNFGLQTYFLCY